MWPKKQQFCFEMCHSYSQQDDILLKVFSSWAKKWAHKAKLAIEWNLECSFNYAVIFLIPIWFPPSLGCVSKIHWGIMVSSSIMIVQLQRILSLKWLHISFLCQLRNTATHSIHKIINILSMKHKFNSLLHCWSFGMSFLGFLTPIFFMQLN